MTASRPIAIIAAALLLVIAPVAVAPAAAAAGQLSVNSASVSEGGGTVTIVVDNLPAGSDTVTATLSTVDATATSGSDYVPFSQVVTLASGSNTFPITITDDALHENLEFFIVQLSAPSGGATIANGTASVTINDDDAVPGVGITPSVTHAEGDAGTTAFTFIVSLTAPSATPAYVDYATADGTASAGSDYAAASGTLTFAAGTTAQSVTILVAGDTVYEADQTFTVNLSSPADATISGSGVGTGTATNDDTAPTLAVSNQTVSEDAGTVTVTVTRTGATEVPITVDYAAANGTATAPTDYTNASGTLTFAPSLLPTQTSTLTVPIVADAVVEPDQTFTVGLSNAVGATAGGPGTVTITDLRLTPAASVSDVTLAEGNAGTSAFTFAVTLNGPSASTVEVSYATADGGALAGSDYAATSGVLTFVPGDVSETVTVLVAGDTVYEQNQNFQLQLLLAINATIADPAGTGRILNDDAAPVVAISPTSVTAAEGDTGTTTLTFTVTRTGATEAATSVRYDAVSGTASVGSDFAATTGTATFAPSLLAGPVTSTFTIAVAGDVVYEGNETFQAVLSSPVDATLGAAASTITITDDDPVPAGLASTGDSSNRLSTFLAALLLLGVGAVAVRRRRRTLDLR